METKTSLNEVILVSYSQDWPKLFSDEAQRIRQALHNLIGNVYHIGSTAIIDMPAKPIIDIIIELQPNLDPFAIQTALLDLGYGFLLPNIIPKFSFFTRKQAKDISFHLHLLPSFDHEVKRHLLFRDYLNRDKKMAQEYAKLKANLSVKYRYDRFAYTANKSNLIKLIDLKARNWAVDNNYYVDFCRDSFRLKAFAPRIQIIDALQANVSFKMCYFAQYLSCVQFDRLPGFTAINSGYFVQELNYIIDAAFTNRDNVPEKITAITQNFNERHIPFIWQIAQRDQPNNLEKYLLQAKFKLNAEKTGMYLLVKDRLDHLHTSSVDIVRVLDKGYALAYAQLSSNNNAQIDEYYLQCAQLPLQEDDLVQMYLGYADGEIVVRCCIALYAGVVGVYELFSSKEESNNRYIEVMLDFVCKKAHILGFEVVMLISDSKDEDLLKQHKFISCCKFKEFALESI